MEEFKVYEVVVYADSDEYFQDPYSFGMYSTREKAEKVMKLLKLKDACDGVWGLGVYSINEYAVDRQYDKIVDEAKTTINKYLEEELRS